MFDFTRCINGKTYYTGILVSALVIIAASILRELPKMGDVIDTILGLTIILTGLSVFVYLVCIVRQRANDIGWHPLIVTLFGVTTPLFLVLGLIPGQNGQNKFGPKPSTRVNLKP